MRWIRERLLMMGTVAAVLMTSLAFALAPSAGSVAAGIAVIAVGMLLTAQFAGVALHSRELTVGGRAREHRQPLTEMAAPQHPSTPGRRRSRAPSGAVAVV